MTGTETTSSTADTGADETTATKEASGEVTTHTEVPGAQVARHSESSSETILGLNLESTTLVIIAAAMSVAFAALTWRRDERALLFAAMVFAVVFATFDTAEVAHQIKESRAGLALLAATIALLHVATAFVAGQRATTAR